jgi:hypothetical protein
MVDDSRGSFREYFRRASSEGARQKMTQRGHEARWTIAINSA